MFQIQPFNTEAAAAVQLPSAFANVVLNQWDVVRNDGDGNLEVVVGGQVLRKARELYVVLAGFSGATFTETRRQFWLGKWSKANADAAVPPDCYSEDGNAPHASAPHKQHTDCRTCPRSGKNAEGYTDCGYTKDMLVYMVDVKPDGQATLVLDTPLIWRVSSMSLFAKHDPASQSAGVNATASLLQKSRVAAFEMVVFQLGFHQSGKAPTLKAVGMLPEAEAGRVIAAAAQPDVKARLEFKAPKAAAALPAPPQAAALPPPVVAAPAALPPAAPPPAPAPAPAPAPVAPPPVALPAVNLVPPASPTTIAAAEAPVGLQAAPPAAAPVTFEALQAELTQAMLLGQAVDPAKLQLMQQLMAAKAAPGPAPAPAPAPMAAPASAQAAALAAFALSTPTR